MLFGQTKNTHSLQSKISQNKSSKFREMEKRATFLTLECIPWSLAALNWSRLASRSRAPVLTVNVTRSSSGPLSSSSRLAAGLRGTHRLVREVYRAAAPATRRSGQWITPPTQKYTERGTCQTDTATRTWTETSTDYSHIKSAPTGIRILCLPQVNSNTAYNKDKSAMYATSSCFPNSASSYHPHPPPDTPSTPSPPPPPDTHPAPSEVTGMNSGAASCCRRACSRRFRAAWIMAASGMAPPGRGVREVNMRKGSFWL